jgi:membrane protease YdiL (CAAX protease family)
MNNNSNLKQSYGNERLSLFWFFILLFVCTLGALPMILDSHGKQISGPLKLLQLLMLFGPALVALIASYVNGGNARVKELLRELIRWRVHFGWYLLAIFGPLAIYAASLLISNASGFSDRALPDGLKVLSTFAMTLGVYLLLNTEELAWRGYALPRLQSRFGIVWATVIIGLLWALIHSPLFWLKGGHPAGYTFAGFTIRLLFMNILFTVLYYGPSRSILIVHLLHQSLNASVEAIPAYPKSLQSAAAMNIAAALFFVIGLILFLRLVRQHSELITPAR